MSQMTLLWKIMEYWPNIPYLVKLLRLGAYLGRLGGLLNHLNFFKLNLGGDTCQNLIGWKIMEIKIFFIIYIIIISIIIICNNNKQLHND